MKKKWNAYTISKTLANEIVTDKYPVNTLLPTRENLVKRFGVARATVDKAVNELVNTGMIQSRRGAGSIVINTSRLYKIAIIANNHTKVFSRPGIKITNILPSTLTTISERNRLKKFDGIIWSMPDKQQLLWAKSVTSLIPQIIVNRTPEKLNYVSTAHAESIYNITNERLNKHPDWLPVFLGMAKQHLSAAIELRQNGFIKACRKYRVFYELINMPDNFDDKLKLLKNKLNHQQHIIIVSGSLSNTGAVIAWVREANKQWGKNILYSDFDNDYPENVWGISVTSFLQDYEEMHELALSNLLDIIKDKKKKVQILQPPIKRKGNT